MKLCFNVLLHDSRFEHDTGIVTATDGPDVTVQTPSNSAVRHKNQIEPYTRRKDPPTSATSFMSISNQPEVICESSIS